MTGQRFGVVEWNLVSGTWKFFSFVTLPPTNMEVEHGFVGRLFFLHKQGVNSTSMFVGGTVLVSWRSVAVE